MSSAAADRPLAVTGPVAQSSERFVVGRSSAEQTAELRRAVLRPHLRIEQMALGGDQNPETTYLSVRALGRAGTVLGCVRLEPVPCPWRADLGVPAKTSWQLRAMATDPAGRGTGLGRRLVQAAVEHVSAHEGDLIWCNARVSAEGFYVRQGFHTVTEPFVQDGIPEAHVGMVRQLGWGKE